MKKILITAVLFCAALFLCIGASAKEIVTLSRDDIRVQLLSKDIIRVERADSEGNFVDDNTLVVDRASFEGVTANVTEDDEKTVAVTSDYTVTLYKNKPFAEAVVVTKSDGSLSWKYANSMFDFPKVTSTAYGYLDSTNGSQTYDGLTPATAKKAWGAKTGDAVIGLVSKGGRVIVSGRGGVSGNLNLNMLDTPLLITAKDNDIIYTDIENNCSGCLVVKGGSTFKVQSDVIFDDITIYQNFASAAKFAVVSGATIHFGDGVSSARANESYPWPTLNVEGGSVAIVERGCFSSISGSGLLVLSPKVLELGEITEAALANFEGEIVLTDRTPFCTISGGHVYDNGVCTKCGYEKGESSSEFYPINTFYSNLPEPYVTPKLHIISDSDHVFLPESGFSYVGSTEENSGITYNYSTDLYLILTDEDSQSLRKSFVKLTGRTELLNIHQYGAWYSRYHDLTADEILGMIDRFHTNEIPLDTVIVDTNWRTGGSTGYEVNTDSFPDMEKFISDVHEKGLVTLFNDHPHQMTESVLSPTELEYFNTNLTKIMDMGIDGWWFDRNWTYKIVSPFSFLSQKTLGMSLYHGIMKNYHAENANENGQDRTLIMAHTDWMNEGEVQNDTSIISHRYGVQTTGDILSTTSVLKLEVEDLVTSGVIGGNPNISTDLGGYKGNCPKNLYIRWSQFAAFSPIYRMHNVSTTDSSMERSPFSYDEETQGIIRSYLNMRYSLLPYAYAASFESYENGMPIVRRLDYYYPENEASRDNTQYLYGRDILVAPIYTAYGEGDAVVPSEWLTTASGTPGVTATFYNNKTLEGDAVYSTTMSNINCEWHNNAPNSAVNANNFSVRFEGKITPDRDIYIGGTRDDGIRIYIDGKLVVDAWKSGFLDGAMSRDSEDLLKANQTYDLKMEYYDGSGNAYCYLIYEEPRVANTDVREVFIPSGEWIDVFTGEVITGPKTVTVTKDMYSSPLYVRKGAVIPTAKVVSPMTGADWQTISVNVYGMGDGSASLYEDDGETENYQAGDCRLTEITAVTAEDCTTLTISAAEGEFATAYSERTVTVRVHSDLPIQSALVGGKTATVVKVEKDASALPFAESGASPATDVYEITFTADIHSEHIVQYTTSDKPLLPALLLGDADGDGNVTVRDALLILRMILNDAPYAHMADMNEDGKLSLLDVMATLKYATSK